METCAWGSGLCSEQHDFKMNVCRPGCALPMCLFLFYSETIKTFLQSRRNTWKRPSDLPPMQLWRGIASAHLPLVQSGGEHPQACDRTIQYVSAGLTYRVQDLNPQHFKCCVSHRLTKIYPPLSVVNATESCFYLFKSTDKTSHPVKTTGCIFYLTKKSRSPVHAFKLLKWEKYLYL